MVKQTSIRSASKFPTEYKIPEWFDLYHYNFEQETKNQRVRKKFYNSGRVGLSDEDAKLVNITSSDELCILIDNIIYTLDLIFNMI